ncbi:MAG: hypothetical protein ACRC10_09075 [Thermoguttaceae bacterium]
MSLSELSFLSPKIKVLSATVLLLTGTGCAAFFPAEQSESTSETNVVDSFTLPVDLSLNAFPLIPADSVSSIVDSGLSSPRGELVAAEPVFGNQFVPHDLQEEVLTQETQEQMKVQEQVRGEKTEMEQRRAKRAERRASQQKEVTVENDGTTQLGTEMDENEYVVVQPDSPYGKYLPPPSFDTEKPKEPTKSLTSTPTSMSAQSSSTSNSSTLPGSQWTSRMQPKLDTYSGIDDPDLAKTLVELSPLQRWNNVFESSPPLNDLTKSQKEWLTRKSQLSQSESTDSAMTQEVGTTRLVLPTDRLVPSQINKANSQNQRSPAPLVIPNNQLLPLAPVPD